MNSRGCKPKLTITLYKLASPSVAENDLYESNNRPIYEKKISNEKKRPTKVRIERKEKKRTKKNKKSTSL